MSEATTSSNFSQTAAYIWSLADLLRGDFKQSQYGRVILPFTLLRRLEGVLENTKGAVLKEYDKVQDMDLPETGQAKFLLRKTKGLKFYNISQMDLSKLGEAGIKDNLDAYIQGFSQNAREIFEYFKFDEFIAQLDDANLLYKIIQRVKKTDLSPKAISNHDMGLVFEELIRRFAESSNETAGEHFTPRDIVRLTTSLVFMEDDDVLTKPGIIRTIYDPTAGTGGFLSSGMEYVYELNHDAKMAGFGQELNPESYAICKADMLIKGQEINNIKLGNTLSNDQLYADKFDYMLSNPPFGVDWKKIEQNIKDEHSIKGFDGRFGPGLPRVSDGSLLFLLHLISKLRDASEGDVQGNTSVAGGRTPLATGGRIGIILNGSPLFTGGAGSGESEIRRYILESDLLEAIVALPTDMFYNTGIATYVWVLSNKKTNKKTNKKNNHLEGQPNRKGQVQLINGVNLCGKMRKSLGSKRNIMSDNDIATITRCFGNFEAVNTVELDKPAEQKSNRGRQSANPKKDAPKTFASKIFKNHEFGYRRITIERPLRESYQFSDERIAELRFANKPLTNVMKWIWEEHEKQDKRLWHDNEDCEQYGDLTGKEDFLRKHIKSHFPELKEKNIKDLLNRETWLAQKQVMQKAKQLQSVIGKDQYDDMNTFETALKQASNTLNVDPDKSLDSEQTKTFKLETKEKKQITDAVSWKNPDAEKVVKKVHKGKINPLYGLFETNDDSTGKQIVVEYKADGDLRDNENVALNPSQTVNALNEAHFKKEVQPHVPDAWIDATKTDAIDGEIGIVGYEIPFNRHFYVYQSPRDLEDIDADLDKVSSEIMELLREVHS